MGVVAGKEEFGQRILEDDGVGLANYVAGGVEFFEAGDFSGGGGSVGCWFEGRVEAERGGGGGNAKDWKEDEGEGEEEDDEDGMLHLFFLVYFLFCVCFDGGRGWWMCDVRG